MEYTVPDSTGCCPLESIPYIHGFHRNLRQSVEETKHGKIHGLTIPGPLAGSDLPADACEHPWLPASQQERPGKESWQPKQVEGTRAMENLQATAEINGSTSPQGLKSRVFHSHLNSNL